MAWLISQALMKAYENSHSSPGPVEESSEGISSDGEPSVPSSETPTPQAFCAPDKMKAFSRLSRSGMTFAPLMDDRGEAVSMWSAEVFPAKTSALPDVEQESTAPGRGCGERWRELLVKYDLDSSSWRTHRCLFDEALPWSSVTLPRWGMMRRGVCWERLTLGHRTSGRGSGLWLTPTAHNAKEGAYPAEYTLNTPTLAAQVGGKLNPTWIEWLMGWPIGWTDLGALETDRFQQWRHSHGGS
jgi:hypothetical protein